MNRLFLLIFLLLGLLVGCTSLVPAPLPTVTQQPFPTASTSHSETDFTTRIPLPSPIPLTATTAPSRLATILSPTETAAMFCDRLLQTYTAISGFQTYCDADYGFAIDYPMSWSISEPYGFPDTPGTSTVLVRRALQFEAYNLTNYIRVDSYRMPDGSTLAKQVEQFWSYPSREIPDQPYDVRIGGQRAYAIFNRWHQDYSAVHLFFQHGEYYSVMLLKAISHTKLDTDWQIAASIQIPGKSPLDNQIPEELIQDSHTLTIDK